MSLQRARRRVVSRRSMGRVAMQQAITSSALIVRCGMSASQVARSLMLLCRSRMTCVMPSRGGSASTAMVGPVARVMFDAV